MLGSYVPPPQVLVFNCDEIQYIFVATACGFAVKSKKLLNPRLWVLFPAFLQELYLWLWVQILSLCVSSQLYRHCLLKGGSMWIAMNVYWIGEGCTEKAYILLASRFFPIAPHTNANHTFWNQEMRAISGPVEFYMNFKAAPKMWAWPLTPACVHHFLIYQQ